MMTLMQRIYATGCMALQRARMMSQRESSGRSFCIVRLFRRGRFDMPRPVFVEIEGQTMSLREVANLAKISRQAMARRIKRGLKGVDLLYEPKTRMEMVKYW